MRTPQRAHRYFLAPFVASPFWTCVAPKAQYVQREPGAAPQDSDRPRNPSAEGATHFQHQLDLSTRLKRTFSAGLHSNLNSWGDAPGWHETGPLALDT